MWNQLNAKKSWSVSFSGVSGALKIVTIGMKIRFGSPADVLFFHLAKSQLGEKAYRLNCCRTFRLKIRGVGFGRQKLTKNFGYQGTSHLLCSNIRITKKRIDYVKHCRKSK